MQTLRSAVFDQAGLLAEIRQIKFHPDGSGAWMAYPPSAGIPDAAPLIRAAVMEIAELRGQRPLHLMINWLDPTVMVPSHRDWIKPTQHQLVRPTVERWHLPVKSNLFAEFWHESDGYRHFEVGEWIGPIPYWQLHSVHNLGDEERIHIVVDLDTPIQVGRYKEDSI